jgi:hypothetical protein
VKSVSLALSLGVVAASIASHDAFAHGFAGKRFFPATLATEDPFVADELSLPTIGQRRLGATDEGPGALQTSTAIDFTKRITPNLGIGVSANYLRQRNADGTTRKGFDNWGASLKYQFHKNDERESIASLGLDWDMGGTGARGVGAESFSTLTPGVFVGKGLGDLPDGAKFLRPLAFTGVAGLAIPSRSSTTRFDDDGNPTVERHSDVLRIGGSVQYSLPYLQSFVKDVGLAAPFNRMIPLVEFNLQKPVDRGASGWTGTVNPGVIWAGRYMQLGLEAVIPVNSRTGGGKGFLFQVHFFLDDLFPQSIGRPVF